MQRGTHGFWRGILAGIVVAIAAALLLAWVYPPLRAPEVDNGMQVPPAPPGVPGGAAEAIPTPATDAPAGFGALPPPVPETPRIVGAPASEAAPTPAH